MKGIYVRGLKIFSLFLVLGLIGICGSLVWPRVQYEKGLTRLRLKEYDRAAVYFERAEKALPGLVANWFALADLFRIQSNLGRTYYHLGVREWQENGVTPKALALFDQARSGLARASAIEPMDYINAFWLARTKEALETVYPSVNPKKKNPHDALAYLQNAMGLRPSGISVRYVYARYLYRRGMREEIPALVREMMAVYPPGYKDLKNEAFFNGALIPSVEQGLQIALKNKRLARDAVKSLSRVSWDKKAYGRAIQLYEDLLSADLNRNTEGDYIYMGALLMAAGQKQDGFVYFEKVLNSKRMTDASVEKIYEYVEDTGQFEEFIEFSFYAKGRGIESAGLDLCVAKSLIRTDRLQFARSKLIQINVKKEDPRAYQLLALIAQKEKDWEGMKKMAEQALVFEPGSAQLHYLLSKAYEGMELFPRAKELAQKAVQLDPLNQRYKHQERKFGKVRSL
jgi:tetratricopeptide (TPR) repeat protein